MSDLDQVLLMGAKTSLSYIQAQADLLRGIKQALEEHSRSLDKAVADLQKILDTNPVEPKDPENVQLENSAHIFPSEAELQQRAGLGYNQTSDPYINSINGN